MLVELNTREHRTLRRYDQATIDVALEEYRQGVNGPELIEKYHIEKGAFYYHVRRAGIEARPSSVPHKHPAAEERVCAREGCEETFVVDGYRISRGEGLYCSRACHYTARQLAEPEERVCARKGCKVRFTPYPSEAVRPGRGRFCSPRCRALADPRRMAKAVQARSGSTRLYGRKAGELMPDGKKNGAPFTKVDAGKAERILKLADQPKPSGRRRSEREIADLVGLSKTGVHNVLANRQGVIDHFSLHDLV